MNMSDKTDRRELTDKEEALMRIFWERGPLFVREIVELYPEPKPHFNTISTFVRGLEAKGYVAHEAFGNTYRYYAVSKMEDFRRRSLGNVIKSYFNNSYLGVVSSLVEDEKLSIDELRELIDRVEKGNKQS